MTHDSLGRGPRVAICFHPPAHYRQSLVNYMEADSRVEVYFAYDPSRSRQPISHIPRDAVKRYIPIDFRMFAGLVWLGGAVRLVTRRRFDAVVFTGDPHDLSTWVCLVLGRLLGVPVLLWSQGWRSVESGIKGWVRRCFYGLARGLLVYGERARDRGIQMGFPAERIVVTYNSVPDTKFSTHEISEEALTRFARAHDLNRDVSRIVFSSRLKRLKRLDLLLEALASLRRQGIHLQLVIVGAGEYEREARAIVKALDLDVRFLGAMYNQEELASVYALSDISVLPAHAGLAVVQSLQHGVPVVVNDDEVGNGPEVEAVLPGVTGSVYERGSIEGLANAILEAVRLSNRESTVEACRRMANDVWSARNQASSMVSGILRFVEA